jgi:hypothetical protein
MAAMSFATRCASVAFDFFIGILLVEMTAIAQQAVYALGNCFFCSGQTRKMFYLQNIPIIPQCSEDRTFTRLRASDKI